MAKFNPGDKVRESTAPHREGKIVSAKSNPGLASGTEYDVDFGGPTPEPISEEVLEAAPKQEGEAGEGDDKPD